MTEIIHSGTHGSCSWEINSEKTLRIFPTDGKNGTLANQLDYSFESPWERHWEDIKKVIVEAGVAANEDVRDLFFDLTECEEINLTGLDTHNAVKMSCIFGCCKNLKKIIFGELFDTSKATEMVEMFWGCYAIKELDLNNWNTEEVEYMQGMFSGCRSLVALDLSNFRTSKVVNMSYMFENCESLIVLDVSNFNTANVESVDGMFRNCESLVNLDIKHFNLKKAVDLKQMFA